MLPAPIALQGFQAVCRRNTQIVKPFRRVDGENLGSRPSRKGET
jgi:hypothetical protein